MAMAAGDLRERTLGALLRAAGERNVELLEQVEDLEWTVEDEYMRYLRVRQRLSRFVERAWETLVHRLLLDDFMARNRHRLRRHAAQSLGI